MKRARSAVVAGPDATGGSATATESGVDRPVYGRQDLAGGWCACRPVVERDAAASGLYDVASRGRDHNVAGVICTSRNAGLAILRACGDHRAAEDVDIHISERQRVAAGNDVGRVRRQRNRATGRRGHRADTLAGRDVIDGHTSQDRRRHGRETQGRARYGRRAIGDRSRRTAGAKRVRADAVLRTDDRSPGLLSDGDRAAAPIVGLNGVARSRDDIGVVVDRDRSIDRIVCGPVGSIIARDDTLRLRAG